MTTITKIEDRALLSEIADRAHQLARSHGINYSKRRALMDISAAHEARPIDLEGLLNATDGNFGHDVFGIERHIDRASGVMRDCFVPRYTAAICHYCGARIGVNDVRWISGGTTVECRACREREE